MQICKDHWAQLRAAINERGLSHLVSTSGIDLSSRLKKELNNEATIQDPLMGANFAIMSNALQHGGLYLMSVDENSNPYCPLCEALKHYGDNMDQQWIKFASDEQLDNCKAKGLLNNN